MSSHPLHQALRWLFGTIGTFALLFGAAADRSLSDSSRVALLIIVAFVWARAGWKLLRFAWRRLRFAWRHRAGVWSLKEPEPDGHGAIHHPAAQTWLKIVNPLLLPDVGSLRLENSIFRRRPEAGWPLFRNLVLSLLLVACSIVIAVMLGEPWAWLAGWLPIFAFLGAVKLWKHGLRYAIPAAAEVRATDSRPPVLLLRSFLDEQVNVGDPLFSSSEIQTLTHLASDYFNNVGPVVALPNPKEKLPRFGPFQVDAPAEDEDWRDLVRVLSREASLVVVCVGRTPGVVEELILLADETLLSKTRLLFPPVGREELAERSEFLRGLVDRIPALAPLRSIDYRLLRAAYFDLQGDLVALCTEWPTRKAYERAIQVLVTAPRPSPHVHTKAL
jgi:hypothetical protein